MRTVPGSDVPVVDVSSLRGGDDDAIATVAHDIDVACRRWGFFCITGHGIEPTRLDELEHLARDFFARPDTEKAAIAMHRGGAAWRGWFPLEGELTSGRPDHKEGIYFGTELPSDHPAVAAGRPLHGPNLFPREPPGLRRAVLDWLDEMSEIGQLLLGAVARGLGLPASWFVDTVAAEPTILFRIFQYPPGQPHGWGVAEHTDYGLLTILAQDGHDGLEVRGPDGWVDVPSDRDVLVVNLGDMLERMTAGRYRSTPHRVRNRSSSPRLSFPCFIDPSWDATCPTMPLAGAPPADDPARRWDGSSVRAWQGTYGDYLVTKVAKVFPDLFRQLRP